jgi:hypothetical protein
MALIAVGTPAPALSFRNPRPASLSSRARRRSTMEEATRLPDLNYCRPCRQVSDKALHVMARVPKSSAVRDASLVCVTQHRDTSRSRPRDCNAHGGPLVIVTPVKTGQPLRPAIEHRELWASIVARWRISAGRLPRKKRPERHVSFDVN